MFTPYQEGIKQDSTMACQQMDGSKRWLQQLIGFDKVRRLRLWDRSLGSLTECWLAADAHGLSN